MKLPLRAVVTGGREQRIWPEDYLALGRFVREHNVEELVHGACPTGVDPAAAEWARLQGLRVQPFPADWDRFGRAAGPIRNGRMARYGHVLLAFPGGRGTADMERQARAARMPIYRLCRVGVGRVEFLRYNGEEAT